MLCEQILSKNLLNDFKEDNYKIKEIYPWHSWIARQTPTLKVNGSNPFG